jgi:hypothetical protein
MWRKSISLLIVLSALAATGPAWADRDHFHGGHRGHGSVHFYFGPPVFDPWYYGPPPYYYPPHVIIVPSSPPVYIEKTPEQAAPSLPSGYWYYCSNPKGYYPYVKECPGGWQQVAPQPPPQP